MIGISLSHRGLLTNGTCASSDASVKHGYADVKKVLIRVEQKHQRLWLH